MSAVRAQGEQGREKSPLTVRGDASAIVRRGANIL